MVENSASRILQNASESISSKILLIAATSWLTVATIGQWIFATYILLFYGKNAVNGEFEKWNKVLPHGYIEGDWKGNFVVGMHILIALVMVIGGPLQLIPYIRKYFPYLHRLLGRVYVAAAIIVSSAGLVMVWTRGTVGDQTQRISISFQAVYIILFALISIFWARNGRFESHRKWSLRLFMVVNGVWFFRVGLMFWLVVNGGPVGFDPESFTGPFLTFLAVGTYAIPISLIVLEMYFLAHKKQDNLFNICMSIFIFVLTCMMGIGIFGATLGMWLPQI